MDTKIILPTGMDITAPLLPEYGRVLTHEALDFVARIGKTPVVVNDSRGFFTSRVFSTYFEEGMALLAEGVAPALIENAGRLPASVYRRATMYTTLSPCDMCTGAILLYGIPRVVLGENRTFMGAEDLLRSRGVEVVNLDSAECKALMDAFIAAHPDIWNEDIGEE